MNEYFDMKVHLRVAKNCAFCCIVLSVLLYYYVNLPLNSKVLIAFFNINLDKRYTHAMISATIAQNRRFPDARTWF